MRTRPLYPEIFLVSFGVILLEISYTRIFSFKLFYYFTYLIVGIALLGMGSGGVFTTVSPRFRRVGLSRIIPMACMLASSGVLAGYFAIAFIQLNSMGLPTILREDGKLLVITACVFIPFLLGGIVIATVFSEDPGHIHRLYFADLLGAGIGCALVVPLIGRLTPPACVFLSGLVFIAAGTPLAVRYSPRSLILGAPVAVALLIGILHPALLPEPVPDELKTMSPQRSANTKYYFSAWSPVFRIDVMDSPFDTGNRYVINHDGIIGSTLHRFDGNLSSLKRFDHDSRSYPFVVARPNPKVLIIGAAGGHEILASLYFGAFHITGIELNPATYSLLTTHFADYTGHIATNEKVTLINGEGRSFLRRDESKYDLIWFVAPDSYAAMNSATSGAFVLSESYLYTTEMIEDSLAHLTPHGIICMSFGEVDFAAKPNRTSRYLSSARVAFTNAGAPDFPKHVILVTQPSVFQESMMLFKRSPFTAQEIDAFRARTSNVKGSVIQYAWTQPVSNHQTNTIITANGADLERLYREAPYEVGPVTDDAPFFWHFARFSDAIRGTALKRAGWDMEDATGERVLMTLLATVIVFATVFLLLPFLAIRETWTRIPYKGTAAVYFAALGIGFMFFEIVLIQKFTLFLGYPTYSLTVTLFALLLFTGIGSLVSPRYTQRRNRGLVVLLGMLMILMLFYQFGMGGIVGRWIGAPLAIRIGIAVACLAPLGLCLGAFMPVGLRTVAGVTEHKAEFVAWAWAVNGFFSVISSILATILSMTWGFTVVLTLAALVYLIGIVALRRIPEMAA
ncbi:MAG: hypothetical protein HY271_02540 [Deltaproteobacteria bacterium]|nr:hypothetical protein [Deltaproteobacteria bacterium]